MAMNVYSTFPKGPALLEPHSQSVLRHISGTLVGDGLTQPVEMQSVYSTATADWAILDTNT